MNAGRCLQFRAKAYAVLLLGLAACVGGCDARRQARNPGRSAYAIDRAKLEAASSDDDAARRAWLAGVEGFDELPAAPELPITPPVALDPNRPGLLLWWPSLGHSDAALERLRGLLAGRRIYGYGGIAVSCRPAWTHFYAASTGLRVRSVSRDYGHVTWIGVGPDATNPAAMGSAFLAYDPLRIVVDEPGVEAPSGTNVGVGGKAGPCPSIELADFQIATTISLHPPPFRIAATPPRLRLGMSRDELIWTRGYPDELGTMAGLRREAVWRYGIAGYGSTVTFRNNRVISFTDRSMM